MACRFVQALNNQEENRSPITSPAIWDDKQCSWRQPWRGPACRSLTWNSLGLSWHTSAFGASRLTASPPNHASSGHCSHGRPPIISCCSSLNQRSAVVVSTFLLLLHMVNHHCEDSSLQIQSVSIVKVCTRGLSNSISAYNHCESVTTVFFPCKHVFPLAHASCFSVAEPTSSSAACSLHFWTHPFISVCHKLYLSLFSPDK